MKKCYLTIIYQTKSEQNLLIFIEEIKSITQFKNHEVENYNKINNSYKINFSDEIDLITDSISYSVLITNKICDPWLIFLRNDEQEIELIFNKEDISTYRKNSFNPIIWSNFLIESL
ncbi:hypothetical protein L1I30_00090 [Gillisia sp. M10.2A]|uniref:Uncharacterized protein n=1 Tax=Gillisia lutea TaxID=2909668 RepID=A0ABS9EB31_9FLAO|nr:hypothetical protein [Gillisia lutea]MCF4100052.1 hypothetical protein [Gillisia lutea]